MAKKFRKKYRIEPKRMQQCDYSAPGSYFITICTEKKVPFLGEIKNGKMQYSKFGKIVKNEFSKIPSYHRRIVLDEWVIMPDHVHLLMTLGWWNYDNKECGRWYGEKIHEFSLSYHQSKLNNDNISLDELKKYRKLRRNMIIPKVLGKFKTITSREINIMRNTPGHKNWQHDYNDIVIFDLDHFIRVKNYIRNNPGNWKK